MRTAAVLLILGLALQVTNSRRCWGKDDGCCTTDNPCFEGDGDCDNDDECAGDLCCGGSCPVPAGDFDIFDACCKKPPCGCFSLDGTVSLSSGQEISLSGLKKGDLVKTLDAKRREIFTPFMGWIEKDTSHVGTFVQLTTENSSNVVLTHHHFLMTTPDLGEGPEMKRAEEVAEGDFLLTTSGLEKVDSISRVTRKGLGAPLTMTGDLLVNGVLSSNYAHAPSHSIGHLWMSPFRWLDLLGDSDTKKEDFVRRYSTLGSWLGDLLLEIVNSDQASGNVLCMMNIWNIPLYMLAYRCVKKVYNH